MRDVREIRRETERENNVLSGRVHVDFLFSEGVIVLYCLLPMLSAFLLHVIIILQQQQGAGEQIELSSVASIALLFLPFKRYLGSPMIVPDRDYRWAAVGVATFREKCNDQTYPGVYTRITHYLPWIQRVMRS